MPLEFCQHSINEIKYRIFIGTGYEKVRVIPWEVFFPVVTSKFSRLEEASLRWCDPRRCLVYFSGDCCQALSDDCIGLRPNSKEGGLQLGPSFLPVYDVYSHQASSVTLHVVFHYCEASYRWITQWTVSPHNSLPLPNGKHLNIHQSHMWS